MKRYDPKVIEAKWQQVWADTRLYEARDDDPRPKAYIADMFPYPSGDGLHVGHVRNYTISDVMTRHKRMQGFNVLHPMGWDAFGLPAENYAIKVGVAPQDSIAANTVNFRQQIKSLGISIDWSREVNTSSPDFYRWTQWIFTVLFERGLAYQKESEQWWCEHDKTVLANEQVEQGKCWRCGNLVTKKLLKQWFFKITDYADELLDGLDNLDWPDRIKTMQRNWIGRSRGAELTFTAGREKLTVYTTRPDTLAGATFLVVAPEHPALAALTTDAQRGEVEAYVEAAKRSSEIERQNTERTKTGVFTGAYSTNPLTGAQMPVWTADYVLAGYGTGAIMAVPAHDARDYEFATAFDLPIVQVVAGESLPSVAAGPLQGSGQFDGLEGDAARRAVIAFAEEKGFGRGATNFKLRDWLISRQRYWGTPIPVVHCVADGAVAVPADQLPVELPRIADYLPSGDGRSPLAKVSDWVNTTCPKCGGPAERETDTMDTFADSSWYFLRYADANNDQAAWSPEAAKAWLPVGTYIGGAEHAVLHLMYARFWTKALRDAGYLEFGEPFASLRNHGMILAPDGSKMSKSKGNVINPNQVVERYGADSVRLYELFVGPYDQAVAWSDERLSGMSRFVWRVWTLAQELLETPAGDTAATATGDQGTFEAEIDRLVHRTLKRVHDDLHDMGYNTAISALMELINGLTAATTKARLVSPESAALRQRTLRLLTLMLAPFAPHIAEEIWHNLGEEGSVHVAAWPAYDPVLIKDAVVTIVVQVNGKVRANLVADVAASEAELVESAKADPNVAGYLNQGEVVKTIVVPRKLVNFVVR